MVQEPGKTGSLWRIHYSFERPTLVCDYFEVAACEGEGSGESLRALSPAKRENTLEPIGAIAQRVEFIWR